MARFVGVKTSLDPSSLGFIKRFSRGGQPKPAKGSSRTSTKNAFISLYALPEIAHMQAAVGELQHVLLSMTANKMKRVAASTLLTIRQRSGSSSGIKSNTLRRSWRMPPPMMGAEIKARSSFSDSGDKGAVAPGMTLFGYGIYTQNNKFLDPIFASSGTTDLLEILEYGSRPHIIRPRNPSGRLRFEWEKARTDLPIEGTNTFLGFVGQSVKHPGTRPYGFTRIAVAEAQLKMLELLRQLKSSQFFIGR